MSNRFYGTVGFADTVDAGNGIHKEVISARPYQGDVEKNSYRVEAGPGVHDDIRVTNSISIVADAYAFKNYADIKYVEWNGVRWRATYVEVDAPRIIISLGGIYNG